MPTSVEAVVILVFLVSPGLIFFQFARRSIANIDEPSDVRFLVTMITAGAAIHVVAFPWSNRILDFYLDDDLANHRGEITVWAILIVFLMPAVIGGLSGLIAKRKSVDWLLDKVGLGYVDRLPSAWDYVMEQRTPRYVRIYLKDGAGVIGGVFANRSFGSTDPKRADLYLEQIWSLDESGNFLEPIPTNQGVWISHDAMAFVHFLEGMDESEEQGMRDEQ